MQHKNNLYNTNINRSYRRILTALLALLLILLLAAQKLKPYESSGKYGFVDETDRIVIPAQYDKVNYFENGLAFIMKNGKCGFIDKTGKAVIPIIYDDIMNLKEGEFFFEYFKYGLAIVKKDGKYGAVDRTGQIIIPAQYDWLSPFQNDITTMEQNGKWGVLDRNGKIIIPCLYDSGLRFTENMASALLNDKYGFIDKKGRMIIPATFEYASVFAEGLALVRQNDKYGFIDTTGKLVIPAQFDDITDFTLYGCSSYFPEDMAEVKQNGKWGFIDRKGNVVITPQFDSTDKFSGGIACVSLNGKQGLINKTGKFVIPAEYDMIEATSEDLVSFKKDGKYGYMDKTGNILIPARFEQCYGFNEGMAAVEVNGKWGFIDIKGELTIPAQYTCVVPFSEGLAAVEIDDKWGAIDQAGNLVIPAGFDDAFFFDKGLAFVEQEDNIYSGWFFIDKQGRRHFTEAEGREFLAQEAMQATTPRSGGKAETVQSAPDAGYADRVVDVDSGIPQAKGANFGTYAVVIANENYRSVADVGNAANDGNVLHQYLTKTLGIPENNVIYCENASAAMMDEALSTLETKTRSAAALGKAFNVIFYYSGHGVPAEGTSDAFLLPVDVSPKNLKRYGFSLDELYRRLGALEAQCVTVLLDACFSGAGRTGAMLADVKGVALEPKKAAPTGNMVVLPACSGSQTAHIFKEGKHGLFTYWLLRKLKETKGEVTLGELQEHLAQYVDYTTTNRLNLSGQQPTLQVSPTLSRNWRAIPLR